MGDLKRRMLFHKEKRNCTLYDNELIDLWLVGWLVGWSVGRKPQRSNHRYPHTNDKSHISKLSKLDYEHPGGIFCFVQLLTWDCRELHIWVEDSHTCTESKTERKKKMVDGRKKEWKKERKKDAFDVIFVTMETFAHDALQLFCSDEGLTLKTSLTLTFIWYNICFLHMLQRFATDSATPHIEYSDLGNFSLQLHNYQNQYPKWPHHISQKQVHPKYIYHHSFFFFFMVNLKINLKDKNC